MEAESVIDEESNDSFCDEISVSVESEQNYQQKFFT
jgi:hypothetical protein